MNSENIKEISASIIQEIIKSQDTQYKPTSYILNSLVTSCLSLRTNHLSDVLINQLLVIYSHLRDDNDAVQIENLDSTHYEHLVKTIAIEPMRGLLPFDINLLIGHITSRNEPDSTQEISLLIGLLNEFKLAYLFLCREDKIAIKSTVTKNKDIDLDTLHSSGPILYNWIIIEVAKQCISNRLSLDGGTNRFLQLLHSASKFSGNPCEKMRKRSLINLLLNLEKHLEDRVHPSSSRFQTFIHSSEIEEFYTVNSLLFQSWLMKEKQDRSYLSLVFDDPAECWRIMSDKLIQDLCEDRANVNGGSEQYDRPCNIILGTNTKKNQYNLTLMILAAKQLGCVPLLAGIQSLIDSNAIVCDYPGIDLIINNLEGNYEDNLVCSRSRTNLTKQQKLELCESYLSLGQFDDQFIKEHNQHLGVSLDIFLEAQNATSTMNIEVLKDWLETWLPINEEPTSLHVMENNLNLIIPSCLRLASKESGDEREAILTLSRSLMSQDLLAQLLFPPARTNNHFRIFQLTADLIGNKSNHLDDLIKLNSHDLRWNHLLYNSLESSNMLDRVQSKIVIETVELRTAKFHMCHKNFSKARLILNRLKEETQSVVILLKSCLLLFDSCKTDRSRCDLLLTIAKDLVRHDPPQNVKYNLAAMILRRYMSLRELPPSTELDLRRALKLDRPNGFCGSAPLVNSKLDKWRGILTQASTNNQIKVLTAYSHHYSRLLSESKQNQNVNFHLNAAFQLDLELLSILAICSKRKFKSQALDCAGRLLDRIVKQSDLLNERFLDLMLETKFISDTLPIWTSLKLNLMSIVQYKSDLKLTWRGFVVLMIEKIIESNPEQYAYLVIVNRLDLESELVDLGQAQTLLSSSDSLIRSRNSATDIKESQDQVNQKTKEARYKLCFWSDLERKMYTMKGENSNWPMVMSESEDFIREIRKISFLKGEYLKNLTVRIPKRLLGFLEYFAKLCESSMGSIMSKQRMEECENRLESACKEALFQISNLLTQQLNEANITKYDAWFRDTFDKQLRELGYRVSLLGSKRPLVLDELDRLIKSIIELMSLIRQSLTRYYQYNRQKLYMELISPKLSRFEPSSIPMPEHYAQSSISRRTTSDVTIYKVFQTVDMISSKTSPKKLTFTGSDGVSRSYLLKAHDDLRIDQLVMCLFSTINDIFAGHMDTCNKYRLRRYAVTPISSRSGLIQWIEAPSLATNYREWLHHEEGRKLTNEIFASTCQSVCEPTQDPKQNGIDHTNCQVPSSVSLGDLFYQVLWGRTKPTGYALTETRPFFGNSSKYRESFPAELYEEIVDHLSSKIPNDLLKQSLWYSSSNAQAFWLKTQSFIKSCATISMVGYVIGLGDRHLENILIDKGTGEAIHIDYNICFELGKTLAVPEQVPFRLTPTMVRAFGFAGLEGEFTSSSVKVLNVLKDHKSLLLHLLDPINLSFMIGQDSKSSIDFKEAARASYYRRNSSSSPVKSPIGMKTSRSDTIDMCSQESEKFAAISENINNLLMFDDSPVFEAHQNMTTANNTTVHLQPSRPTPISLYSSDMQQNIKTPTKIQTKTADNIHRGINDKLSGCDEALLRSDIKKPARIKQILEMVEGSTFSDRKPNGCDLIELNNSQSTRDQVDCLIAQAMALKNRAAMFEGWMPWV